MEVVEIELSKIIPYENNPRENKQSVEFVCNSLKEFGWRQPIVCDEQMVIIAGHTRLKAAQKLGYKVAPVHIAKGMSEEQVKMYRLADNKVGEGSKWEFKKLDIEFKSLFGKFDFPKFGFDAVPKEGDTEDDAVPEVEESVCKLGDLWELGEHRLLCGDSTKLEDVSRLMNGEKADMVFTDPPYGIDEQTDRKFASRTRQCEGNTFEKIKGDKTTETAIRFCKFWLNKEIKKYVIWGANYFCHSLPETGQWLIWDKRESDKERDMNSDCEMAWIQSGKKSARIFRHKWKGMIKASEQGQARIHPTQKPIALSEWCFNEYEAGEIIFDGFLGSGSTLIACEKTNRRCFGMELDEHYCDVIIKRWENFTGRKAVKT